MEWYWWIPIGLAVLIFIVLLIKFKTRDKGDSDDFYSESSGGGIIQRAMSVIKKDDCCDKSSGIFGGGA